MKKLKEGERDYCHLFPSVKSCELLTIHTIVIKNLPFLFNALGGKLHNHACILCASIIVLFLSIIGRMGSLTNMFFQGMAFLSFLFSRLDEEEDEEDNSHENVTITCDVLFSSLVACI